jgi:hypothetical protein
VLTIHDVTSSIGGRFVDHAATLAEARHKIEINGHVGYVYTVTFHEPPAMRGAQVAAFRVRGESVHGN